MEREEYSHRIDPEWITLNTVRDLIRLASGDPYKSTYNMALKLGAEICPEILGADVSILHQERESDLTKEYRQRAALKSIHEGKEITALSLIQEDINEYDTLLKVAKNERDKLKSDKLKRKIKKLYASEEEINPEKNSETQLIFRDAYRVDRKLPLLFEGKNNRTFELSSNYLLTIRVLHPEKTEHITGGDLIYEKYDEYTKTVVLAFVQYKIWENKKLYLSDKRMLSQIEKMKKFLCKNQICDNSKDINQHYRFPYCSGFLRPTDKLQSPNQAFISTGEHLPICYIEKCASLTSKGSKVLNYDEIRKISLSHEMFEQLFNQGKIGSRQMSLKELAMLYEDTSIISKKDRILLYAQEYPK